MTAQERAARTRAADELCRQAFAGVDAPEAGVALVAVGGFGREELAPFSDLDLVLVHEDEVDPGEAAEMIWYPLWDSGTRLDHSVRSISGMVRAAADDVKVASGLLDVRHVAGDDHLTLQLRATMLADWRRGAKEHLPTLREIIASRHETMGELGHSSVPDLKESEGGLRDATVLRSLVATWLIDMPHLQVESARQFLLDVRDVLQDAAGRDVDRIAPESWGAIAEGMGLADDRAAQREVRDVGRRLAHYSRIAWRRVDDVLHPTTSPAQGRRPRLTPVEGGVAISRAEVVLDRTAKPDTDPLLLLRAAAVAAERGLVLAPATASRLAEAKAVLPEPWPDAARQLLVRMLASGRGLLGVWETLEETGALPRILPEWERIRLLPHASVIHRFTVDRHVVETCMEASALLRHVGRPDVLVVAAMLHDIGKGGLIDHSVAGEPVAREVAARMGFDEREVDLIGTLVRWHLLLSETATTRDPDDPTTISTITERITDTESLDLLRALTEADARATSPAAWSSWRAGLIHGLARRAHRVLDRAEPADAVEREYLEVPTLGDGPGAVHVAAEPGPDGTRLTIMAPDRVGLLADVAATLALLRIPVQAARAWPQDGVGVSAWEVADPEVNPAVVRTRYAEIAEARLDPAERLRVVTNPNAAEATVVTRPEASDSATVLEVRAADRPGVIYVVAAALAEMDIVVRSAHIHTLGPQAVDVFYLSEAEAGALSEERAAAAVGAVRDALSAPTS